MDSANITLRQYLSQPKPPLQCDTKRMKNTSGVWPKVSVTVWAEFNLATLNESYGHVLDWKLPGPPAIPRSTHELNNLVIRKDKDIGHLIVWNNESMGQALQFAKGHLNIHSGKRLQHECAATNGSISSRLLNTRIKLAVDHIVKLDHDRAGALVVGIGRTSMKWSGRQFIDSLSQGQEGDNLPLRQLAHTCELARTRYGYIQTDQEMVVSCFSRETEERLQVAIELIPWTQHGVELLTTDLALWWLCMLAIAPGNTCAIVQPGAIPRIDGWVVEDVWNKGWVRRHQYSGLELPTRDPTVPNDSSFNPNLSFAPGASYGGWPYQSGLYHEDFAFSNSSTSQ
jgi:hypothetical protein